ncbi:hypothetical protein [Sphingomonas abietis]|uniref:DUF3144 domain-containing protein n=1 Tax=Sphingomonas abietis TaxID=3012344 RepID=A0ABY7NHG5_9SPHN|nr:hypothetical protein [Sphingomonas abietis]WBO20979.1 hypothetical protein PBT88_12260 [Sphingomonas abietis]
MTEDEIAGAEALRDMVMVVMDAISRGPSTQLAGTAVDAQLAIDAFHYLAAAMLEAHPATAAPGGMQDAAKAQSKRLLAFMTRFREEFEKTGEHPWNMLNVPPEKLQ